MSNTSTENEALIKDFMYKCDCLYRENNRLREKVSAQPLEVAEKEAYEVRLSEKDTIIAKKEAKISKLEERVSYLERQLYGRKAEKFIKPNAEDRWLDFEGFDMLYFRLWELVLQTDYIQSDETTIPVIHDEKHKAVKGYIWLVRSVMTGRQFFYYDHGSRAGKVVLKLFSKFRGAIQTDGYERYGLLDAKKGIILLGCWAHARRKFFEAKKNDLQHAEYALAQIQLLYDVERKADDEHLDYAQRAELRSRLAYPILVRFEKWLVSEYPKVLKDSPIAKAIKYTYSRFDKLSRYHLDGRYRPDNNEIENKVRPVACGRKNYLFCGNHDAAEDAAVLYSFFGCCKSVEVDFRTWLIYFLEHVHDYDNDYSTDLVELLPDNLKNSNKL